MKSTPRLKYILRLSWYYFKTYYTTFKKMIFLWGTIILLAYFKTMPEIPAGASEGIIEAYAALFNAHIQKFKDFSKLKKLWVIRPIPVLNRIPKTFKLLAIKIELVRKKILNGPLSRYHILGILDKLRLLNHRWLSPGALAHAEH